MKFLQKLIEAEVRKQVEARTLKVFEVMREYSAESIERDKSLEKKIDETLANARMIVQTAEFGIKEVKVLVERTIDKVIEALKGDKVHEAKTKHKPRKN